MKILPLFVCLAMPLMGDTVPVIEVQPQADSPGMGWYGELRDPEYSIRSSASGFWDDLISLTHETAAPDECYGKDDSSCPDTRELVLPVEKFRYVSQQAVKSGFAVSSVRQVAVRKDGDGQTAVSVLVLVTRSQPGSPVYGDDVLGYRTIMEDAGKDADPFHFLCTGADLYLFNADGTPGKGWMWSFFLPHKRAELYCKIKQEARFSIKGTHVENTPTPGAIYINPVIWNDAQARRRITDLVTGTEWLAAFYKLEKGHLPGTTLDGLIAATRTTISGEGRVTIENGMATYKRFPLQDALRAYLLYHVSRSYPDLPSDFVFYIPCP